MAHIEIHEELKYSIPVVDEDYPDQQRELEYSHHLDMVHRFVLRMADKLTKSIPEERAFRFALAMKLLQSFESNENSNVLRARLEERFSKKD